MCNHNWVLIEKPRHLKYNYSGLEVVIGKCRCTKCKKIKDRKMIVTRLEIYLRRQDKSVVSFMSLQKCTGDFAPER